MLQPLPTQLSGARFLAARPAALLADLPRVGKTGASIIGADYILAEHILVVTTASGRGVWKAGFRQWSAFDRQIKVIAGTEPPADLSGCVIVGWGSVSSARLRAKLLKCRWDLIILDEAHAAKSFSAKRTEAVYGSLIDGGARVFRGSALTDKAGVVWFLTGTPIPHAPNDLYPMLRTHFEDVLRANKDRGWPDVLQEDEFLHRYCVVRYKKISSFRKIPVVVNGRNLPELRERIRGIGLQRTQADIGILSPVYETLPLIVSEKMIKQADGDLDRQAVIEAAKAGDTKKLDMHLGPLRRLTGTIKAAAVADVVAEELHEGLDKIVLAYWHRDVGQYLADNLGSFGVARIDGSTGDRTRAAETERFRNDPKCRVFLAQIVAAGEAIDLSAASQMIFVETSFTPKDMLQMSLRTTNINQKAQPVVRVACLEGSIDEALQQILLRKWTTIREVMKK